MIIHLMLCHTLSKNANPIILFGKLVVYYTFYAMSYVK